jgi:hypothetical protein
MSQDKTKPHHFYASSICTWRTNTNLEELIADMKQEGRSFNVFYVPLDETAIYKIRCYAPEVEGVIYLGIWNKE